MLAHCTSFAPTCLTHPIGHKHGAQTWNGFGMLACMLLHGGVNTKNGNMWHYTKMWNPWLGHFATMPSP